ncbi:hypothetical protein INR49_005666 [Caranx melampygus]|nr:hypothetical protein INR49_005666 [Caranx melampygus]
MNLLYFLYKFRHQNGLDRPPQRSDVSLAKTCRPSALYQLEEEGVLCKDGLGEHLEKPNVLDPGALCSCKKVSTWFLPAIRASDEDNSFQHQTQASQYCLSANRIES